eukprot:1180055-Prorocentrum_minimum.AAC.6
MACGSSAAFSRRFGGRGSHPHPSRRVSPPGPPPPAATFVRLPFDRLEPDLLGTPAWCCQKWIQAGLDQR